jgi:hypothetical protein
MCVGEISGGPKGSRMMTYLASACQLREVAGQKSYNTKNYYLDRVTYLCNVGQLFCRVYKLEYCVENSQSP